MRAKCPSCNTEYDCEPGRYECECGAKFLVEPDGDVFVVSSGHIDGPDVTIPPRRTHAQSAPDTNDVTMSGRRERKPDGQFEVGDLILGRYKVLSKLGQGGMGVVYECLDDVAGIKVALKALPLELARSEMEMEDVKENFQLVHNLRHPNIAGYNTLERDISNGNYYLIMECVEGEDLRRWIKRMRGEGSLTLENVLPVIRQVAAALDYAHKQKIIHRDIKPGNIMIDSEGNVKVLDFGLAAQIHTSMTRVSMVSQETGGTAPYMAPEQWNGWAQGAEADQYALAVMTYEMLAGHLPFDSTEVSVLREAVLNAMPRPVEGLPEYAQAALLRGMSKDPTQRFKTCSDFAAALNGKAAAQAGAPADPVATAASADSVLPDSPDRKKRTHFGLIALVFAAALVILACLLYLTNRMNGNVASPAPAAMPNAEQFVNPSDDPATAEQPKTEEQIIEQNVLPSDGPATVEQPKTEEQITEQNVLPSDGPATAEQPKTEEQESEQTASPSDGSATAEHGMAETEEVTPADDASAGHSDKDAALKKRIAQINQKSLLPFLVADKAALRGVKLFPNTYPDSVLDDISGNTIRMKVQDGKANFIQRAAWSKLREEEGEARIITTLINSPQLAKLSAEFREYLFVRALFHGFNPDLLKRRYDRASGLSAEKRKDLYQCIGFVPLAEKKPLPQKPVPEHTIALPGGIALKMLIVEAGSFEMSAKDGENVSNEVAHRATLTKDFYIGQTEVTQAQWKAVMRTNPSAFEGDDLPVEGVSWNEAMAFCEKLNRTGKAPTGWKFTLPTETQWEYAARGGKQSKGYKYSGSNNADEVAWYYVNSGDSRLSDSPPNQHYSLDKLDDNHCKIHSVGQKKANELGLYDMSGNVSEWCLDNWQEKSNKVTAEFTWWNGGDGTRVCRGGNLTSGAVRCRSAFRDRISSHYPVAPDGRRIRQSDPRGCYYIGFRLALVPADGYGIRMIALPNDANLELMKVEAGSFEMSAKDGENDDGEVPHQATLTQDFYIGRTEVTQAQWEAVMGSRPWNFWGDYDRPVEGISWNHAMAFCGKLNDSGKAPTGWQFTLPTETQWEYAARGGKKGKGYKYSGSNDIGEVAWYKENSVHRDIDDEYNATHPVGQKKANELGLYDMSGNVWEWCLDDWNSDSSKQKAEFTRGNDQKGSNRVVRGGGCGNHARLCRSANRSSFTSDTQFSDLGFRVALVPEK